MLTDFLICVNYLLQQTEGESCFSVGHSYSLVWQLVRYKTSFGPTFKYESESRGTNISFLCTCTNTLQFVTQLYVSTIFIWSNWNLTNM
jgi:hypothetical protein